MKQTKKHIIYLILIIVIGIIPLIFVKGIRLINFDVELIFYLSGNICQ